MSSNDSSKEYIIIENSVDRISNILQNVLLFRHYSSINRDLYDLDPIEEEEDEE